MLPGLPSKDSGLVHQQTLRDCIPSKKSPIIKIIFPRTEICQREGYKSFCRSNRETARYLKSPVKVGYDKNQKIPPLIWSRKIGFPVPVVRN